MEKKHIRIYISPMGQFRDPRTYKFVAEFESEKLVGYYMRYMRNKDKYRDKDIILQEVTIKETPAGELTVKGDVVCVCAVTGEYLCLEEIEW